MTDNPIGSIGPFRNSIPNKQPMSSSLRRHITGNIIMKRRQSVDYGRWISVCNYVADCKDVRSSICRNCGFGKVYDKNNIAYRFDRIFSIEDIKSLIEKVRKINSPDE